MNNEFIPYKRKDVEQERFYRIPKEFVENDTLREGLDNNMKMLYGLIRDRYELSIKNNWIDDKGEVYCIYSREKMQHDLNISKNYVTKCIKKLTELNLMKEIRYGQGKPNHMYISRVETSHINRLPREGILDSLHKGGSDTDVSETEKIKRYTIASNGAYAFEYYEMMYYNLYQKDHPTVTEEQLDKMNDIVETLNKEYDLDDEEWMNMINRHFHMLKRNKNNNGNILGMLSGDDVAGPMVRYLDER